MKFYIMDRTGHSTLEFSKGETDAAMEKFKALIGDKFTAATRKAGQTDYTVIKDGKDTQDETLFVPALRGG